MNLSSPPVRSRLGCAAALVLATLILASLGGFIFCRVELAGWRLLGAGGDGLRELAGKARDTFVAVAQLQPQVTVNEQVIFTQSSPMLELAVISQQTVVERETSTTWLGSTKRLRIRGVYNAKAGFDLRQPFTVRVGGERPGVISARIPPAKLLSVEQQKLDVLALENGIWNHVDAGDLSSEIGELNRDARAKVWKAGILEQAEKTLVEQLKSKLGAEYQLDVTTEADPGPASPAGLPPKP